MSKRPEETHRDYLGRLVREAWVRWAKTQPDPKPSWLVPYEELAEADKEADRQIGEYVSLVSVAKSNEYMERGWLGEGEPPDIYPDWIYRAREAKEQRDELLETCKAVANQLDYLQNLWSKEGVTNSLCERVRTAIAKASRPSEGA